MSGTPDFWKLANEATPPKKPARATKAGGNPDGDGKGKLNAGQWLGVSGGAVALLAIMGLGAWWLGRVKVPDVNAPPAEIIQFAATDTFANMTLEEKRPFLEKMEGQSFRGRGEFESLNEDQRREGFRNLMEGNMDLRLSQFLSLKSKAERDAYIDQQLDEMAKRMANRPTSRPANADRQRNADGGDRANRGQGGRRGMTAQQQKNRTENRDWSKSAARMEMMSAMRKRAEERGLPMPNRGGPGGGRGGR